jgi:predicted PurR-regulated permease PerM
VKISAEKTTYVLLAVVLSVVILKEGELLLKPMAFALLATTIFLKPSQLLERWGFNRFWSVLCSIILGSLLIVTFGFFMSSQIYEVGKSMKGDVQMDERVADIFESVRGYLPFEIGPVGSQGFNESKEKLMNDIGMPLLGDTFTSVGKLLSSGVLTLVYTFLILLYRHGIAEVLVNLGKKAYSKEQSAIMRDVLNTGQQYIAGLSLLIVILASMYAVTFWLFGLDYPLLFGGLAAVLAIIPYIGTTLGASLPVVYSFLTNDNPLIALALIGSIIIIQSIEGNFLTPKIVGGSMKLNPLASIVALALGGFIWGLAGMIIFLPLAAMVRIIAEHFINLKPLASLSGDDITNTDTGNE